MTRPAKPLLQVIVGSTRPGRVGKPIADWFAQQARADQRFDIEMVDLLEVNLPVFDEPNHPRLGHYIHQHTKMWSEQINRADAYIMVIPEYNYGYNSATKNAIDYLHNEWAYKALGFVSYGGVASGTRAVQALKQVVTTLRSSGIRIGEHPVRRPVHRQRRRGPAQRHHDSGCRADVDRARPLDRTAQDDPEPLSPHEP